MTVPSRAPALQSLPLLRPRLGRRPRLRGLIHRHWAIGKAAYIWSSSTSDSSALQKATSNGGRIAACWYSGSSFNIDVNCAGTTKHRLALYFLDWDTNSRAERIDIIDPATGAVL